MSSINLNLFCLLLFCLSILKAKKVETVEEGFQELNRRFSNLFKNRSSSEDIKELFTKGKIGLSFNVGFYKKSLKEKTINQYKGKYQEFVKNVYGLWNYIETPYIEHEFNQKYTKPKEGPVCTENCFNFSIDYYSYFIPQEDKEIAGIFNINIQLEAIPLIETVKKERCWKVFLFFTKCETEEIKQMKLFDNSKIEKVLNNLLLEYMSTDKYKDIFKLVKLKSGMFMSSESKRFG